MRRFPAVIVVLAAIAALQTARFGAVRFFKMAADGEMSWAFALPAGIGDLLIAATAPWVVFVLLKNRTPTTRRWVIIWNIAGIADLLLAVTLGFLTNFPLQARLESVLADDLTMGFIPMVAVPACVLLHLVGIVTLSRARTAQLFS